jgi:hypothetical protein
MRPVKTDFKKDIAAYRAVHGRFDVVTVPVHAFLMVDGHGDPNTAGSYRDAVSTIFPLAYALKFLSKRELDRDYTVMPLEALWWADDPAAFTTSRDTSRWEWTLLNLVPDWITTEHFDAARAAVAAKGGAPALDAVRLEPFDEGLCVQTLHLGPYDAEGPVLAAMHDRVIPDRGFRMTGKHHEIYLGDPRRTAPEKLRTILRQPVARL